MSRSSVCTIASIVHRKTLLNLVLVAGFMLCPALTAYADTVRLILNSEPGNFIGQGRMFDITYDTARGDTVFTHIARRLPDGSPTLLDWSLDRRSTPENEFAGVSFGTNGLGVAIQPGVYPEARRAAFAPPGFAGLDVSFQNRGSNLVFGNFTINEVTFSADRSRILTFDAVFLQRSESPTAPALRGRFQFNIAPTTPVPEPATLLLLGAGCMSLLGYRKIR